MKRNISSGHRAGLDLSGIEQWNYDRSPCVAAGTQYNLFTEPAVLETAHPDT
jgi:hypothetical protein